jgi:hypothetical protein
MHPTNEAIDRYLAIVAWAKRRYTVQHRLVLTIGGRLSRYSKIERMAFERCMLSSAA